MANKRLQIHVATQPKVKVKQVDNGDGLKWVVIIEEYGYGLVDL